MRSVENIGRMEARAARMTDAFLVGLDLREHLRFGKSLLEAFEELKIRVNALKEAKYNT